MAIKKNVMINTLSSYPSKYALDIVGKTYNRLYVLSYCGSRILPSGQKQAMILAQCSCGNINTYIANHVKGGRSTSCGCLQAELSSKMMTVHGNKKGGMPRGTKEYSIWQGVKYRCKNNINYIKRGITICPEWSKSFISFLNDVGVKPSESHTLERIDNDKGYFPENCKWATRLEQANNTSRNVFIEINGERLTLAQAKRKYGIGHSKAKTLIKNQVSKSTKLLKK